MGGSDSRPHLLAERLRKTTLTSSRHTTKVCDQ